jgi:hypothetical protein
MRTTHNDRREVAQAIAGPPLNANAALQVCQFLMAQMAEFNGNGCASWTEMHRQWATFLNQRLQEDSGLVHHLANCTHPGDVYAVYSTFYQKALADYQSEFAEMMRLGSIYFAEAGTHEVEAKKIAKRGKTLPAT